VDFHLRNDPNGRNKAILQSSVGVRLTISSGFGDFSVSSLVNLFLKRENNRFYTSWSSNLIYLNNRSNREL